MEASSLSLSPLSSSLIDILPAWLLNILPGTVDDGTLDDSTVDEGVIEDGIIDSTLEEGTDPAAVDPAVVDPTTVDPSTGDGVTTEAVVDVTVNLVSIFLGIGAGVIVGLLVALAVQTLARFLMRNKPFVLEIMKPMRMPLRLSLALAGGWLGMMIVWSDPATEERLQTRTLAEHGFLVAVILAVTWLIVSVVNGIERSILNRIKETGESRYRRTQTQLEILHRIIAAAIWIVGVGLVLMTFEWGKTLGGALFTSAGLLSVTVGIAAQATLGNVFAGLQLAFSDSLRMGDIVIWQDEFTTVEEITLTYVVLKVWDGRRLIVPSKEMTSKTFENWTRRAPDLLGRVEFELDWDTPITEMRAELGRILARTDMWDGDTGILQVLDATGGKIKIGALLSGRTSAELTDLKYYVREELVKWIQSKAPDAAPHTHIVADELDDDGAAITLDFDGQKLLVAGAHTSITEAAKAAREQGHEQEEQSGKQQAEGAGTKAGDRAGKVGKDDRAGKGDRAALQVTGEKDSADDFDEPSWPTIADVTKTQVIDLAELTDLVPDRVPVGDRKVADPVVAGPPTGPAAGHESSIFTGSLQAEKRRQEFSGPGEEAFRERNAALEKRKAVETGKLPRVEDATESE
ncbi:MAG: mechanosensitive ion channel [Ancrocorticia sp.]